MLQPIEPPSYKRENPLRRVQKATERLLPTVGIAYLARRIATFTNPFPGRDTELTKKELAKITADDITLTALQLFMRIARHIMNKCTNECPRRMKLELGTKYWLAASLDVLDGMLARKQAVSKDSGDFNIGATVDALSDRLGEMWVIAEITSPLKEQGQNVKREHAILAVGLSTIIKSFAEAYNVKLPEQSEAGMIPRRKQLFAIMTSIATSPPRAARELNSLIDTALQVARKRLSSINRNIANDTLPHWENLDGRQKTELIKVYILIDKMKQLYELDVLDLLKEHLEEETGISALIDLFAQLLNKIPKDVRKHLENEQRLNRVIRVFKSERSFL